MCVNGQGEVDGQGYSQGHDLGYTGGIGVRQLQFAQCEGARSALETQPERVRVRRSALETQPERVRVRVRRSALETQPESERDGVLPVGIGSGSGFGFG